MKVLSLHVYPVKGCRGVDLAEAAFGPLGAEHDRRFAFVDADGIAVTQREQPLLATIVPALMPEALRLDLGGLCTLDVPFAAFTQRAVVDVWRSAVAGHAAAVPKVEEYLGTRLRLVRLEQGAARGFVDSRPVLVTTTGMLAALGVPGVGMERFRPNVVLEGSGAWRELRGRDLVLDYAKPCGRCEVPTIDQASGARRGPEPLRTITERFDGNFGIYCTVARAGRLRAGDTLAAA